MSDSLSTSLHVIGFDLCIGLKKTSSFQYVHSDILSLANTAVSHHQFSTLTLHFKFSIIYIHNNIPRTYLNYQYSRVFSCLLSPVCANSCFQLLGKQISSLYLAFQRLYRSDWQMNTIWQFSYQLFRLKLQQTFSVRLSILINIDESGFHLLGVLKFSNLLFTDQNFK